jgi:mRNA interferase HigB
LENIDRALLIGPEEIAVHIITKKKLREFWRKYPDSEAPLKAWTKVVEKNSWRSLANVKIYFPTADLFCECAVFNIGGNKYRLITHINYRRQKVYTLHVLTHKEYDKEKWKDDCNC